MKNERWTVVCPLAPAELEPTANSWINRKIDVFLNCKSINAFFNRPYQYSISLLHIFIVTNESNFLCLSLYSDS